MDAKRDRLRKELQGLLLAVEQRSGVPIGKPTTPGPCWPAPRT